MADFVMSHDGHKLAKDQGAGAARAKIFRWLHKKRIASPVPPRIIGAVPTGVLPRGMTIIGGKA